MNLNNKTIQKLREIGLSENEALIYLFLSKNGESTAYPIIKNLSVHRSVVYTSLNHLIDKKIVSQKMIRNKKVFYALSLNYFLEKLKYKENLTDQLLSEIEIVKNESLKEITIHEGNEEYLVLLNSITKQISNNSEVFVIGTGGMSFMHNTMIPIWDEYHKNIAKKNIKIKMISYEGQREFLSKEVEKYKKHYQIKYLKSKDENPSGIHIYPEINTVLNIIYSNEHKPVTAIKIEDKSLTSGNMLLFTNLWNK